ncbi:DNA adenine methylase [Vagococcus lutrae]|uniref:DNA methyltransferase n=1 Tax=Vagococcus lutrae TaxID=81947 RepID=UPI001C94B6FE|nr:DNA methyltransferase [Vagococcus lutrae]QZN88054.1 DNA adenine methylase [Vagococcus lutrae]
MNDKFIDYQGSKADLVGFIKSGIAQYINENDTVLDIFAGSGAVSSALNKDYRVFANDVEAYASAICSAILNPPKFNNEDLDRFKKRLSEVKSELIIQENLKEAIELEQIYVKEQEVEGILKLYANHETVWNSDRITPDLLRSENSYNLFTRYYGGSYFGIEQAIEIDSIIKTILSEDFKTQNFLYACLFNAMNNTVFSRDGHMAQPLNFKNNSSRGFKYRSKSLLDYFIVKVKEQATLNQQSSLYNKENGNKVFNENFEEILTNDQVMNDVDLVYADPPYTDMQYSRYYHLLNVAKKYNYPELTKTSRGYTVGLYTEGRFQSDLSKKSKAKSDLIMLIEKCKEKNVSLALSYAYPQDEVNQATDRYTVSIKELIDIAKSVYSPEEVSVFQKEYNHTNHRNAKQKPVNEFLILCGKKKKQETTYDIPSIKAQFKKMKPTNRNPIYNTHLYWSQKSFNVIDTLIQNFTDPEDVVFDPFMGSGVTVLEAIKKDNNRKAIGIDINEMPIFISKTILEYSFQEHLEVELSDFLHDISILSKYYDIDCPNCEWEATIERVIFDKPERESNEVSIKAVNIECPKCKKVTLDVEDIDVQGITDEMFTEYDYNYVNSEFRYVKNSKIAVVENDKITNIFTARNLKVLDEIITASKNLTPNTEQVVKYVLMSFLHQAKITDKRSNSQWPLWIPKKDCVERNVVMLFNKKMNAFIKALKSIKSTYNSNSLVNSYSDLKGGKAYLLQKPSQQVNRDEIPDNSVDLIITDPPYLDQVLYSEYMQLYSPILGFDFNLEDEIVVSTGENRDKDLDDYYNLMHEVFKMGRDKLKENKLMCLYFHESNLDVWYRLIKSLYEIGYDYKGQVHIQKNNTLKNIISPRKSLKGDLIMFFNNTKQNRSYNEGRESIEEIEINLMKEAKYMISVNGPMTTTELYDNGLMEILITNGWLKKISKEYKTLVEIFEKHLYWDKNLAQWHIKELDTN